MHSAFVAIGFVVLTTLTAPVSAPVSAQVPTASPRPAVDVVAPTSEVSARRPPPKSIGLGSTAAELVAPPSNVFAGTVVPTTGHPGWTDGHGDVSPQGSATYRMPLWVPTGRQGLARSPDPRGARAGLRDDRVSEARRGRHPGERRDVARSW